MRTEKRWSFNQKLLLSLGDVMRAVYMLVDISVWLMFCFSLDDHWNDWLFSVHTHPAGSHRWLRSCLEWKVGRQVWGHTVQGLAGRYVGFLPSRSYLLLLLPTLLVTALEMCISILWAEHFLCVHFIMLVTYIYGKTLWIYWCTEQLHCDVAFSVDINPLFYCHHCY